MPDDLEVIVGIDTAAAEAGLRRLSGQFQREVKAIDGIKAEAVFDVKKTRFDKKLAEAKRALLEMDKERADPEFDADDKEFKAKYAKTKLLIKELNQEKIELAVDSSQLRNANKAMAISAKRQEAMAKQTEKLRRHEERLEKARRRAIAIQQRAIVEDRRREVQVHKLREEYAKLATEEDRLAHKTGRPGGILRSPAENRRLALVRANLVKVREEIEEMGGSIVDIDPEMERHGSLLGRWARSLSEVRLHLGFFSANLKQLGAVLILVGPALTGLLGALVSLVGVLGTSLAGALAVSTAALAGFALAAGGVFAVVKPIAGELEAAIDASEAYNKAVLKYGRGSEQAATANEKLQQTLKGISPEARKTIRDFGSLNDRWAELTETAREPVFESAAEGMKTVEELMPTFARETVATTDVLAESWDKAMRALRSDSAESGIADVMSNFRDSLPSILDGLGNIASMLGRIGVSASKFLPSLGRGFEDWTETLDRAVGRGDELDDSVGRLIGHMRDFGRFSQATARLLVTLFNASADSGAGLLRTMTDLFNRWADWMQTARGEKSLRNFFAEAADETRALFAMLGRLTAFFFNFSRAVAPISDALVDMLIVIGNIIDAAKRISVLNDALAVTAKILAGMWAVGRVQKFAASLRGVAAALGLVSAAQGASGATGPPAIIGGPAKGPSRVTKAAGAALGVAPAAAAYAAGRAGGGNIARGMMSALSQIKWARVGAVGIGVGLADAAIKEFQQRSAERSDDLFTSLRARSGREKGYVDNLFEDVFGISLDEQSASDAAGDLADFAIRAGKGALETLKGRGPVVDFGIDALFGKSEDKAAENVLAQLEEMAKGRSRISDETERSLRAQIAEADWTDKQKTSARELLDVLRAGRRAGIRVTAGTDPKAIQEMIRNLKLLRSGSLASLGDINKIVQRQAQIIATTLPRGSEEARRKTAESFRSAASAIKKAMEDGTISVKRGTKRMRDLLRNARLLEGRDPLGLAKGFADSWEKAGHINARNRERMINELKKMPPQARREAFAMMMQYGRGLVNSKKIPEKELELFKSRALVELDGVGSGFQGLSGRVYTALLNIGNNLKGALRELGGKPNFNLRLLRMLPDITGTKAAERLNKGQGRQQGGFTVPGYGSGDHIHRELPVGAYVMNREASSAFGLNTGGTVHTVLEPRERVFMPDEVRRIGPERLEAMNAAVPRAKGGPIGPMPQLEGRPSAATDIGRGAISKAYRAAEAFFNRQKEKFASAGGVGPLGSAPGALGAVEEMAARFGLSVTSGYRPGDDGWHGSNRARDFSNSTGPTPEMMAFAKAVASRWGSRLLELIYTPLGWSIDNGRRTPPFAEAEHYNHVHVAMQKGGLLQALADGGFVDAHAGQKSVALSIARNLLPRGLNYKGAAGIIGNAWRESRWEPGSEGTGGGGLYGFTAGAISLANLKAAAARRGTPWTNIDFQNDFMWEGPEPASRLRGALNASPTAAAAAELFDAEWERSGVKAMSDRKNGAREAMRLMAAAKLDPNSGAEGSSGGDAKALPKTVKVKHPVYEGVTGKGGGTEAKLTKKTRESRVLLNIPDFGPIPEKEGEVRREMARLEHRMLPEYRAAVRQHKDEDRVVEQLKASLAKIEKRIRELRAKLRELRYAKARKRVKKGLARQLGRITGHEGAIEAARRNYEEKEQFATQVVSQEPEQTGELTEDWINKVFEPYVKNQEEPAYAEVLNSENRWRNAALTAEQVATGMTKRWETIIGYPEKGRKPWLENPDLHYPPRLGQGATGLAEWIYGLHGQIERIRNFASSRPPKWWSEHPEARKRRNQELASIQTYFAPQLALAKFRRKETIGVLGQGRESFNWFRGTGSFEESLQDVQGLHWPEQHEKLPSLPPYPVPGMFGGAIWDTQETIKDLGLKISRMRENLSTDSDRAAEISSFEEAIRGLLAGRPFLSINQGAPFMGAFARGGVALVGERGPELAHMPSGTRIHDAEDTARLLEPQVVVDIGRLGYGPFQGDSRGEEGGGKVINVEQTNYFPTPPPDPHTWAKAQVFELEAIA